MSVWHLCSGATAILKSLWLHAASGQSRWPAVPPVQHSTVQYNMSVARSSANIYIYNNLCRLNLGEPKARVLNKSSKPINDTSFQFSVRSNLCNARQLKKSLPFLSTQKIYSLHSFIFSSQFNSAFASKIASLQLTNSLPFIHSSSLLNSILPLAIAARLQAFRSVFRTKALFLPGQPQVSGSATKVTHIT